MPARYRLAGLSTVGLTLVVAACGATGANYRAAAEKAIEGDGAKQLGKLTATCEQPPAKPKTDDTFACTAATADGKVVKFSAKVASGNKVNVTSTNVLNEADIAKVEETAVAALEKEVGQPLGVENMDCGKAPIIFEAKGIVCALTDPADKTLVYDASVTISDLSDLSTLKVAVAENPRGA
jgi:hypothetical protein